MTTELCEIAASFYQRGYAFGSTGNLSVRIEDRVWITPTGRSLRNLAPAELALIGLDGAPLNGNRASKEAPFHLAIYREAGERAGAVVHLHPTHAVALACLEEFGELPAITPYCLMRVAPLAVVPYYRPGAPELAAAIGEAARAGHECMLLRNHGLVTAGRTIEEAADRAEELEETAKLHFLLRGERVRVLSPTERDEIARVFRRGDF